MSQVPPTSNNVGLITGLLNRLRLVGRLLRDPRVPAVFKLVPFLPLVYILVPLDFLPDLMPLLGQVDDLGAVILGVETFIALAPNPVVEEHKAAIAANRPYSVGGSRSGASDNVIDGDYREVK